MCKVADKERVYCNNCRYLVTQVNYLGYQPTRYECRKMGVGTIWNEFKEWRDYSDPREFNHHNDCPGYSPKNKWILPLVLIGFVMFSIVLIYYVVK